ncbi:6-aminohexanoate hydrolase, partial [Citrobacter sp. AAK_AS5]
MDGELGQEYAAIGRGGQRVHLLADLDLLVVTTGGGFNIDEIWPYLDGVLVDPEKPLPANPAGVAQLNAAITAVAQPPPAQPV